MIEKSPGAVGAAATGGTAAIAATTNAAKESIPFSRTAIGLLHCR